jgi:hypothetical protein
MATEAAKLGVPYAGTASGAAGPGMEVVGGAGGIGGGVALKGGSTSPITTSFLKMARSGIPGICLLYFLD